MVTEVLCVCLHCLPRHPRTQTLGDTGDPDRCLAHDSPAARPDHRSSAHDTESHTHTHHLLLPHPALIPDFSIPLPQHRHQNIPWTPPLEGGAGVGATHSTMCLTEAVTATGHPIPLASRDTPPLSRPPSVHQPSSDPLNLGPAALRAGGALGCLTDALPFA